MTTPQSGEGKVQSTEENLNSPLHSSTQTTNAVEQVRSVGVQTVIPVEPAVQGIARSQPKLENLEPSEKLTEEKQLITVPGLESNGKFEEWRPKEIKIRWLCWLLCTQLSLIATMTTLTALSQINSGFANVPDVPKLLANHPILEKALWSGGFLWTFVPTLMVTLYGMLWDSSVSASADRQPFIELKEGGRSGDLTVLLEYRSYSSFTAWFRAFRLGHIALGFCLLFSLLMSLVVVPLSSYFITDALVSKNSTVFGTLTTEFNGSAFNNNSDLRVIMDSVSSTLLQSGSLSPWTDLEYGFQSFYPLDDPGVSNVTVSVTGYSAYLDCHIIAESNQLFNATKKELSVSVSDRGCTMSHTLDMTNTGYTYFVESWSMTDCGYKEQYSRLGILAGIYPSDNQPNSSSPSNISFISCIPSYWSTPGLLTATFGVEKTPMINSFVENGTRHELPFSNRIPFEWSLHMVVGFNFLSSIFSSDFGLHIFRLATKANSTWPLQSDILSKVTSTFFTSIFAELSSTTLLQQTEVPLNTAGIKTASTTRLIVILPVACVLIIMISIMIILTGFLYRISLKDSILSEEPVGLLGYASIVYGSILLDWIGEYRNTAKSDTRAAEAIRKTKDLGKSTFKMGVKDTEFGTVIKCPSEESEAPKR